jgi:lysophospholipase L1-like esterase
MKTVLQGILVAIVGLLLLEGASRSVMTLQWNMQGVEIPWYRYSSEVGWERRPGFVGAASGDKAAMPFERGLYERRFDRGGYFAADTAQVENNTDPKILAFGDSSTFGWGVPPEASYSEVLDTLLPNASVINLGVNGYTSYQGYKAFQKYVPKLNPSVAIVSFNFNDRRYVLPGDGVDSDAKFERYVTGHQVEFVHEWLYTYRFLHSVLRKVGVVSEPHVAKAETLNDITVRVPPASYRENLVHMAEIARDRKIPLIFMILKDHPVMTEHLDRGIALLQNSQVDEAIKELTIAVYLHNPFSDLARQSLARAYEKKGNYEEARRYVRLSNPLVSVHGGYPLFRDVEYNQIMRQVASEFHIKVVEAGRAMDEDPSLFLDPVHPNEEGHQKIAALLHTAIVEVMAQGGSAQAERGVVAERMASLSMSRQ